MVGSSIVAGVQETAIQAGSDFAANEPIDLEGREIVRETLKPVCKGWILTPGDPLSSTIVDLTIGQLTSELCGAALELGDDILNGPRLDPVVPDQLEVKVLEVERKVTR